VGYAVADDPAKMPSMRRIPPLVILAAIVALCFLLRPDGPAISSSPLSSDAYVWQRVHTAAVIEAISSHGPDFGSVVVLAAQVDWPGSTPSVNLVDIDYASLAALSARGTRIGVAIRISEFSGAFSGPSSATVASLAKHLVEQTAVHFPASELQLDFDCPTRRLADYRLWIKAVREHIACPVTITVLPTWLNTSAFGELARSTDGFVLQVHSMERPRGVNQPATLCDIAKARSAIAAAGRLNMPFRVAMPTYGYIAAFDSSDRFVGLSAEGPAPDWASTVHTREIRADASEIAQLVRELRTSHPATLTGLIYYRMPVATDRLNWTYPTLAAVMRGEIPCPNLKILLRHPETGLIDIIVQNSGNADAAGPVAVGLTRTSGQVLASDGGNGFDVVHPTDKQWVWQGSQGFRLPPGDEMAIGWVRTSPDTQFDTVVRKEP